MCVRRIRQFARDERGATLIEYGLILALIFVVMAGGLSVFASQAVGLLNHVSNKVSNATGT